MIKNSEQRNILLIHQHFCPPGGFGNNRSYEIAKGLIAEGHRVTILTGSGNFPQQPERLFSTQHIEGIQIDCIRVQYAHKMSYYRRMASFVSFFLLCLIRVRRYKNNDIIIASSTPLSIGITGLWYKRILQKPLIFETVDLWPDVPIQMNIIRNKWMKRWLYRLETKIYKGSDHIIALSDGMKAGILRKGVAAEKVSVSYNGTNIQQFFLSGDKQSLRIKHNIPSEAFILLYAGTIGLANGLEFFIDVAAELQKAENDCILLYIIGGGNRQEFIQERAGDKELRNVVFLNSMPKNEVEEYFRLADIGIVSFAPFKILETNSANKYYDYLASGLPVVINYGGWQEAALEGNSCGYAVHTPAEAAERLRMLSTDSVLYHKMSQNARALAVEQYDRSMIAKALSALILRHSSSSGAYNRKA